MRREQGFVAIEWVAAIGMLLLPVVVLVATLPAWVERRHVATVAAREAAQVLVNDWPHGDAQTAARVAREIAVDHGIEARDVDVRVSPPSPEPGGSITVAVAVAMPALAIGGVVVGEWRSTAVVVRRIDDYRSR